MYPPPSKYCPAVTILEFDVFNGCRNASVLFALGLAGLHSTREGRNFSIIYLPFRYLPCPVELWLFLQVHELAATRRRGGINSYCERILAKINGLRTMKAVLATYKACDQRTSRSRMPP